MARYQTYIVGDKKVIVISKYAGKAVKGVAKCNPNDTFNAQVGEKLARLRCDEKIAIRRMARARKEWYEANKALQDAKAKADAANLYLREVTIQVIAAKAAVATMEKEV